jgi:Ser/Thr protein kinase RdoA (MazF antagonist)
MSTEILTHQALSAYGLETAQVTTLRHLGNYVAKVEQNGQTYGLRICTPDVSVRRLEQEIAWLKALHQDLGLQVPQPIDNQNGKFMTQLEGRIALLFAWVEGEPVSHQMSPQAAEKIGTLMAKLHRHTKKFHLDNFQGPRFDADWLAGPDSWWATRAKADLGEEAFEQTRPGIELGYETMQRLGDLRLIHSDLHFGNILLHEGEARVIDFDGHALAHPLFDIALTEGEFMDYDDGEELIAAFRQSYAAESGQAFPADDARLFAVAAAVVFLEWVFTSPNPKVREEKLRWVPSSLETIQGVIE